MENTLERIPKCRYKTNMDKRSGFWQVDLTAAAQELLAFITPKGCVFKWKVMPFGVANAPALFQELMNKNVYILRRRPLVQELICREAEMEAQIDDVSLGTNTQEDHVLLVHGFFIVKPVRCTMNRLRHPGPTVRKPMSGLFHYFRASRRRSARAAEARRLGIDYVLRTVD